MPYIKEMRPQVPVTIACETLSIPRGSYYRAVQNGQGKKESLKPTPIRQAHPRALSASEEKAVHSLLNSERFQDMTPYEIYGTLLDEDQHYLCSIRTMYRILKKHEETTPRGRQKARTSYTKPELLARGPNQVWSWDITKLKTETKWAYYYLYVMMDIFSRYVVGWLIAARESATLAEELMASCYLQQGIQPKQLTIHADRGSAMTSKTVAQLLIDLEVEKTHSRPYTSNDNPFSEAQFKTVKYRPDYPARFGAIASARAWARPFFQWYNHQHRHTSLALMTPAMIHAGKAAQITKQRTQILQAAYLAHPERFVRGQPMPDRVPDAVWINPPETTAKV